mmetsp:Transcript_949/g.5980  ORF Transcript_949/g.5980 Transcript_949/m.5980 type:complete len:109 (+) Transcript_949:3134-3460(+)
MFLGFDDHVQDDLKWWKVDRCIRKAAQCRRMAHRNPHFPVCSFIVGELSSFGIYANKSENNMATTAMLNCQKHWVQAFKTFNIVEGTTSQWFLSLSMHTNFSLEFLKQ